MIAFLLQRLVQAILTVFGVVTLVFVLVRVSGDPVSSMVSDTASPEQIAEVRKALGLDESLAQQYISFVQGALQGDLGTSLFEDRSAAHVILDRLPATLQLAVPSFFLGILIAFCLAMLVRWTKSRRLQHVLLGITLTRESIPSFWFSLLLILLFAVHLDWLPALGSGSLAHLVLPVLSLSTVQVAVYLRLFDSALTVQYRSDYIRTARAAGLRPSVVLFRHALPNAVLPIITLAGLNFATLLSGTIVTEAVFSWPGIGRAMVSAVQNSDFPVVQAGVILVAIIFVFVNLAVDVVNAIVDPRIRAGHE